MQVKLLATFSCPRSIPQDDVVVVNNTFDIMSVERPEVSEKREGIRDLGVLDMVRILYSYIYLPILVITNIHNFVTHFRIRGTTSNLMCQHYINQCRVDLTPEVMVRLKQNDPEIKSVSRNNIFNAYDFLRHLSL